MLALLLGGHSRETLPWFTADATYGDDSLARDWLDAQGLTYVMAISCDHRFDTATGRDRADKLATAAPKRGSQRLSCGRRK